MRFFITTLGFIVGGFVLFFVGALISSSTVMLSVMCLILPAAFWLNGYATSKAGIRIQTNDAIIPPQAKPTVQQQQKGSYT